MLWSSLLLTKDAAFQLSKTGNVNFVFAKSLTLVNKKSANTSPPQKKTVLLFLLGLLCQRQFYLFCTLGQTFKGYPGVQRSLPPLPLPSEGQNHADASHVASISTFPSSYMCRATVNCANAGHATSVGAFLTHLVSSKSSRLLSEWCGTALMLVVQLASALLVMPFWQWWLNWATAGVFSCPLLHF